MAAFEFAVREQRAISSNSTCHINIDLQPTQYCTSPCLQCSTTCLAADMMQTTAAGTLRRGQRQKHFKTGLRVRPVSHKVSSAQCVRGEWHSQDSARASWHQDGIGTDRLVLGSIPQRDHHHQAQPCCLLWSAAARLHHQS